MKKAFTSLLSVGLLVLGAVNSRAYCPTNPLEMHAAFFDVNGDGVVEHWETVASLAKLGVGGVEAEAFAATLHGFVLLKSGGKSSAITVSGIADTGRHEGDSGIFNEKGEYDAAAFERFFTRFDADHSGALSQSEVEVAMKANAKERGSKGAFAAKLELPILIKVAGDRMDFVNGDPVKAISKERLREFYQGTLLYKIAGKPVPTCVPAKSEPVSPAQKNFLSELKKVISKMGEPTTRFWRY